MTLRGYLHKKIRPALVTVERNTKRASQHKSKMLFTQIL